MHQTDKAIVRSLMAIAWADGKIAEEETALIDSLISSFDADEDETKELKEYGEKKRTLDDVPLDELDEGSRRTLLQLAVIVSFVDGQQDETEKKLIDDLAEKLEIPDEERKPLLEGSAVRAKALLRALNA